MIVSKIVTEQFIYISLHAEEVVSSNFLEEDNRGIFEDRLQILTLERVIKSLPENGSDTNLVLDFQNLYACQQNLNSLIFKIKHQGYKILLINIADGVYKSLSLDAVNNTKNVHIEGVYLKYFLFEDSSDAFTDLAFSIPDLFDETFKSSIKKYIDRHDKPHTSSYVYLTSYVDIKKFLSYEKELMLYSLYRLAMRVKNKWKSEITKEPILICQSMTSAYIVSILSNLLKLDILILDKIGPINKLYNRLDKAISDKRKYIVVSDLVCLGTEVKIVKNLIQFTGGSYLGNVSLIKVETLSNSDILSRDATISIFSIKKSNNKELHYNIITDLEQL